jgi:hypothetical protein
METPRIELLVASFANFGSRFGVAAAKESETTDVPSTSSHLVFASVLQSTNPGKDRVS